MCMHLASTQAGEEHLKSRSEYKWKIFRDMIMAFPRSMFVILLLISFSQRSAAKSVESVLSIDLDGLHRSHFPKDFIFGAATSALQVEGSLKAGGRGPSVWDSWFESGYVDDNSTADMGADQYHRYEEDVDILDSLNMDAYRFSISWSRIFPDGVGPEINLEGVAYYNRLIDSLRRKGIKPFATLSHWDLPQNLEDAFGGWMDRQIVDHFVVYAEACFAAFGDRVKNWLTFNEPGLYARSAYSDGNYPPGHNSSPETAVYLVGHNFLLAHAAAVDVYRKKFQTEQQGVIGMTVDCFYGSPLTNSTEDKAAAQRRNEFVLGWFLDPIYFGDYPVVMREYVGPPRLPKFSPEESALLRGSADFIGLNHYTTRYVTTGPGPSPNTPFNLFQDERVETLGSRDNIPIGPKINLWILSRHDHLFQVVPKGEIPVKVVRPSYKAASNWLLVVPWGFTGVLKWTWERYKAPIYVTENGMDEIGDIPMDDCLRDSRRVDYLQQYLSAALQAIREGVDLRSYFVWSLLDNWEWVSGYTKRFGIIYVDYNDGLKRYPKDSAFWFKNLLKPKTHSES